MNMLRRIRIAAAVSTVVASLVAISCTNVGADVVGPVVYPSGATVPQRLLRISLQFAEPQNEDIAQAIQLRDSRGRTLVSPFSDPPLWSADDRTLTLLLDPSRQKTGLRNHERFGYVLPLYDDVTLTLRGSPLKTWHIADAACPPLDPSAWRIMPVRIGTRDTLRVLFPGAIDKLSGYAFVLARGNAVLPGESAFAIYETEWRFRPQFPWRAGDRLALHPRLEDPCGDELGESFEHARMQSLGDRRPPWFLSLPLKSARTLKMHKTAATEKDSS